MLFARHCQNINGNHENKHTSSKIVFIGLNLKAKQTVFSGRKKYRFGHNLTYQGVISIDNTSFLLC